jgi:sugar lactone lactonase YvrE
LASKAKYRSRRRPPTRSHRIFGAVKGGTKVQVIVDGLKHTDGPAAMADGTLLYWDFMERRIGKVEPDGKPSTFLSDTDGSSGIGFDSKGRLITILNGKPTKSA